jgi:hypothetical protein
LRASQELGGSPETILQRSDVCEAGKKQERLAAAARAKTEASKAQALEPWVSAAQGGDAAAQFQISQIYARYGDSALAERWLRTAAENHLGAAEAQLAQSTERARKEEALHWYERAAADGVPSAASHADGLRAQIAADAARAAAQRAEEDAQRRREAAQRKEEQERYAAQAAADQAAASIAAENARRAEAAMTPLQRHEAAVRSCRANCSFTCGGTHILGAGLAFHLFGGGALGMMAADDEVRRCRRQGESCVANCGQ